MTASFHFDQARCTGCQACVLACTIENGLAFDRSWRTVYTFNDRHIPDLPVQHLSLGCNHCEEPACMKACPAGAYAKNRDTGFVVFDETKCIGCRYCTWACPYAAPRYDVENGVVGKCTFCDERQAEGLFPACVALCPTGALRMAKDDDRPGQGKTPGLPESTLGPALKIKPASGQRPAPECSVAPIGQPFLPQQESGTLHASLRQEWPLTVFTFLMPILVALLANAFFTSAESKPSAFLGIAAVAAILSTAHLGKVSRAWRACLNPMSSWLSREVLCFTGFCAVGGTYLVFTPSSSIIGALALALGFATLFAIDRVYGTLPLVGQYGHHSASTILTGLLLLGVFSGNPLVSGLIGVGKLSLYMYRKFSFYRHDMRIRLILSAVRIVVGGVVPTILWILLGADVAPFVMAAVLIGELIDRSEFYAELEPVSPSRQMALDLEEALHSRPKPSATYTASSKPNLGRARR